MLIQKFERNYYFTDDEGTVICGPYDDVWAFSSMGLALVKKNGKMFFIDRDGNIQSPEFDHISRFGIKGTIKGSAKELFGSKEGVKPFKDWIGKYAIIIVGNKQGVINKKGKIVVPTCYDMIAIERLKNTNFIPVSNNGKWGYVDKKTGKEVTAIEFDSIAQYTDLTSATILSIDGKYGLIDKKGRKLCPFIFDQIKKHIDGCAVVRIGMKYGYIRDDGTLITKVEYDSAYGFDRGFGEVVQNGFFGPKRRYVDKNGRIYRKRPL